MPHQGKKHYNKEIARPRTRYERNNFIPGDSLMRKGTAMRKQINLYWKKRAEEKERYLHRATQTNKS
mgnify:CR=1 FL=1